METGKQVKGKSVVIQAKLIENKKVQGKEVYKFGIALKDGTKGAFYSTNKQQMDFVVGEEVSYSYTPVNEGIPRIYKAKGDDIKQTPKTVSSNQIDGTAKPEETKDAWVQKQRRDHVGYAMRYAVDVKIKSGDKEFDLEKEFNLIYGIMDAKLKNIG